jgi:hypothetical protein
MEGKARQAPGGWPRVSGNSPHFYSVAGDELQWCVVIRRPPLHHNPLQEALPIPAESCANAPFIP